MNCFGQSRNRFVIRGLQGIGKLPQSPCALGIACCLFRRCKCDKALAVLTDLHDLHPMFDFISQCIVPSPCGVFTGLLDVVGEIIIYKCLGKQRSLGDRTS